MRTRLDYGSKSDWDLPRSTEYPRMRRYLKRITRKARRINDNVMIQEDLANVGMDLIS